jgi:hypothetical protein
MDLSSNNNKNLKTQPNDLLESIRSGTKLNIVKNNEKKQVGGYTSTLQKALLSKRKQINDDSDDDDDDDEDDDENDNPMINLMRKKINELEQKKLEIEDDEDDW